MKVTQAHIRVFNPEYLTGVLKILSKPGVYEVEKIKKPERDIPIYLQICESDRHENSIIVQGTIDRLTKKMNIEWKEPVDFACSVQPKIADDPDSMITIFFMCCSPEIAEAVSQALTTLIKQPRPVIFIEGENHE